MILTKKDSEGDVLLLFARRVVRENGERKRPLKGASKFYKK